MCRSLKRRLWADREGGGEVGSGRIFLSILWQIKLTCLPALTELTRGTVRL